MSDASTAPSFGPDREQRIPVKGVRKLTAENMVASAFTAPHVTEFLTVDVTRSMKALDRLRELPDWRGVRVSPLLLVAKAVLLAVRRHPMINSTWSQATGEIVVKEYVNLGIAAATPRGLVVPNIKDAGRLSPAGAGRRDDGTGRHGQGRPDRAGRHDRRHLHDHQRRACSAWTPVRRSCRRARRRSSPSVRSGRCRGSTRDGSGSAQVTTLGLSFDHRIIDGELGSMFLRDVGAFLADPEASLLAWT